MIPVLLIGLGRIASLLEKDSFRNRPCTHAGTFFSPWGKKKFFLVGAIDSSEKIGGTDFAKIGIFRKTYASPILKIGPPRFILPKVK
ncbi:hypothetical protein LEP1GSC101_0753 [Leptospira borgpetersenii str. UI 09149]|nr:hypothetical protein LEP1GSC101_0753 [Leptospira borgpetersenii str. UI 09149]